MKAAHEHFAAGNNLQQQGRLDEALAAYYRAIELDSNSAWYFFKLGEVFLEQEKLSEAHSAYSKAVELNQKQNLSNAEWFYQRLGLVLEKQGQLIEAISEYRRAAYYNSENIGLHRNLIRSLRQANQSKEARQEFLNFLEKDSSSAWEYFDQIWEVLNQQRFTEENLLLEEFPLKIDQEFAYEYFTNLTDYRVIRIDSLDELDHLLDSEEFSIEHLKLALSTNDHEFQDEVLLIDESNIRLANTLSKRSSHYQKGIILNGYYKTTCPFRGTTIHTNHSFFVSLFYKEQSDIFPVYRFQTAHSTFYIITCLWDGEKHAIYFPEKELIILRGNFPLPDSHYPTIANTLKSCLVSYWKKVLDYIKSEGDKKILGVQGFSSPIYHYFMNELPGIYALVRENLISRIECFAIGSYEYVKLTEIFPEILETKCTYLSDGLTLFNLIVEQNYFALGITDSGIQPSLVDRIYQSARVKCGFSHIQEIEKSRKHDLLLWITIYSFRRVWVSQIDGIINLLTNLERDFPNLGVVFDGWTRTDTQNDFDEAMISQERDLVAQICSRLPSKITTYSAVGCYGYEKLLWSESIDFFVSPIGTANLYVSLISGKPGIVHSNRLLIDDSSQNLLKDNVEKFPKEHIRDVDESSWIERNYDLDWEVLYIKALTVLRSLFEIKNST